MAERARALENAGAGALRRGREAECVVERMQMPAVGVVQRRDVAVRGERAVYFAPVHPVQAVIGVVALEHLALGAHLGFVARFGRREHVARGPVAFDAVALDL